MPRLSPRLPTAIRSAPIASARSWISPTVFVLYRHSCPRSASVTVCAFTTDPTDAPLLRLLVEADETTGIRETSRLKIDKITTIPRSKLGERVGELSDEDMIRLSRALVVFLGLAGT